MSWRREVEALIGEAPGPPPVAIEPTHAGVWCRCWASGGGLLGSRVPWGGAARCHAGALPLGSGSLPAAALSFVEHDAGPTERQALLAEVRRALVSGGTLVVVDHNRPRRLPAALAATGRRPRVPGESPAARWRRLAYPTAREAQAAGFVVERLRLAAGERLQIVFARKRP